MTDQITTRIEFDDGDAISETVWRGEIGEFLVGSIWSDGEGLGWNARATSNVRGYWAKDTTAFRTRDAALTGLLHQAAFENRI